MRLKLHPIALALCLSASHFTPAMGSQAQEAEILSAWKTGQLARFTAQETNQNKASLQILGEVYEAENNVAQAHSIYTTLMTRTDLDSAQRQSIQLKLALLKGDIEAYLQWAAQYPHFAAKIAKVVSIQFSSEAAIDLYTAQTENTVPGQLLLTNWLLESEQFDKAEDAAWQAFTLATIASDKRYALALYLEAIRHNNSTSRVLEHLASYTNDADLTPVYIDLLLETGQVKKALDVTEHSQLSSVKARRAALLSLSGDKHALATYYQQAISEAPAELNGYFGLAGLQVSRGDIPSAKAVFRTLADNNPNNKPLLLQAATRMIAMNLQDDAIDMLTTHIDGAHSDPQVIYFLFDTYLHSGQEQKARHLLTQLASQIPANSASQMLVVKGYEALNKPALALDVLLTYQQQGGKLSYDQQLHLADVAKAAGQDEVALTQWETLWQQTSLPARKHFLEGLLVKTTLNNGTLHQQIQRLSKALSDGNIEQHELNLLVALRLAENNLADAESAINQYAQLATLSEQQRLELLASLYGRSRQYSQLNNVWKQLAVVDADNAQQYWQQITLNSLRNNAFDEIKAQSGDSPQAQRLNQVNQLIDNLSKSSDTVDRAFVASIYAMAGLEQEAIKQYNIALAHNADPDTLLQLVELYKKEGLFEDAVKLLQQGFITARNDAEMMSAIDGLLNLFDASPDSRNTNSSPQLRDTTLRWLQRQILARICVADDDTALLMALADIAQLRGEFDTVERVNNAILAQASAQRPSLLRSMISQFSGKDVSSPSSGPAIGDEQKKLKYGRRLLALKHDFPPALYANLGRALLADGDLHSAEQAFSLMTEIPGILNVKQLKGDAYASQHMDVNALTYFQEALLVEQSNFDLIRKTATLEEQFEQPDIANYWYWQGIQQLINQAPLYQPGATNRRTSDSYRFYPTLSEGLLLTLSTEPRAQHLMAELQTMLRKVLTGIDSNNGSAPVRDFPRLLLIVDLMQRLAFSNLMWTEWDKAMSDIQAVFPNFETHQRLVHSDGDSRHFVALPSLAAQANAEDNFQLSLALALHNQDWPAVVKLASDLVNNINSEGALTHLTGVRYFSLLTHTLDAMPSADFSQTFWPQISAIPNKALLTFQLLRYMPDTYQKLEQALGHSLLSESGFSRLSITHINTPPLPGMPYRNGDNTFKNRLFEQLSVSDMIDLWDKLEREYTVTQASAPIRDELVTTLFSREIPTNLNDRVAALLHKYVTANGNNTAPCSAIAPKLILLDIAAANQPVVLAEAHKIARSHPQCARLPDVLESYYAGQRDNAYAALRALNKAATSGISYGIFDALIQGYFRQERQTYIEDFFANPPQAEEQAHQFINDIVMTEGNPRQQQHFLLSLHALFPQDALIFSRLTNILWRNKDFRQLEDIVTAWLLPDASADDLHLLFYLNQINSNRAHTKPHTLTGQPVTDIDVLVSWLNKSISSGAEQTGLTALYSLIFTEYAQHYPEDPMVVALKRRQGGERVAAPDEINSTDITRLVAEYNRDKQKGINLLNTLWRNGIDGSTQFDGQPLSREQLLYVRYDEKGLPMPPFSSQTDFFTQLSANPQSSALLNRWLKALPSEQRSNEQRLYDLIVMGWQQQGLLNTNVHELLVRMHSSAFTMHELQLLVSAIPLGNIHLEEQHVSALLSLIQTLPDSSVFLRLKLAETFAVSGYYDIAGELLIAAVWQMNYPAPTMQNRIIQSRFNAPTLLQAVDILSQWDNSSLAAKYLTTLIDITDATIDDDNQLQAYWQAFVLLAHAKVNVPLNDRLKHHLSSQHVAQSALLLIAQAKYLAKVEQDSVESETRLAALGNMLQHRRGSRNYNRELDALASRLFGPQSALKNTQAVEQWFLFVTEGMPDDWKTALNERLSNIPIDIDSH